MAEYNPSKIIKDGNTYNFRDDTKIPLAGSNQISGDLIPSTDGTVNLGSASYQWNNAYIKSLIINGVACGDILTHNASEFVDVTSAQTIGGQKTFSHDRIGIGRDIYHFASNPYSKNTPPANTSFQYIWFSGNSASQGVANSWYSGYIEQRIYPDGSAQGRWLIRDTSESNLGIELFVNGGDKQFRPQGNNTIDLGTSTNKWKSINGIAPDELGLPTSTYTDVSSYITHFDAQPNTFTAPVSGLLYVDGGVSNSVDCAIINYTKGCGLNLANNFGTVRGLFPVEKDDIIDVYISESITIGAVKIYHLKGKV